MKKTNKTFKRFAAITSASLLAACAMAPVFTFAAEDDDAGATTPSYSITVNNSVTGHTYKAYQIFTGNLKTEENGTTVLSNIVWGNGITADGQTALLGSTYADAAALAATLTSDNVVSFANSLKANLDTNNALDLGEDYTIELTKPGYYLIVDETNNTVTGAYDAYSSYILQVFGDEEVNPKSAKPSVDKQVLDETAEGDPESGSSDGWGETADHAINDEVKFKLKAEIAEGDNDYAFYERYKLVFNDKMSKGLTFDEIESVSVSGYNGDVEYTLSSITTDEETGESSFTLTIDNLLTYDDNLVDGATVEVIYKAKLNSNAFVNTSDGTTTNENSVFLQYSNNPNYTGDGTNEELGKTNEDSVWVFTYQSNNVKYANKVEDGKELAGAGFTLYDANNNPIKLIDNNDGTYTVADQTATTGVVTEMISNSNGIFNIKGLDVGTYTLKETTTPEGYNTCADETIIIKATHSETSGVPNVTLSQDTKKDLNIINNSGTNLPGTGGIGTTIFYLGGGAMAAIGGIYLISKRRMRKSEE